MPPLTRSALTTFGGWPSISAATPRPSARTPPNSLCWGSPSWQKITCSRRSSCCGGWLRRQRCGAASRQPPASRLLRLALLSHRAATAAAVAATATAAASSAVAAVAAAGRQQCRTRPRSGGDASSSCRHSTQSASPTSALSTGSATSSSCKRNAAEGRSPHCFFEILFAYSC
eukprot:SAG22_NODE_212_length_15072_cov_3.109197_18_plen_173_part_00